MQKEDRDVLEQKLAELGVHIKETWDLAEVMRVAAARNMEVYTWIAGRVGAAQVHLVAGQANIKEAQNGNPDLPS